MDLDIISNITGDFPHDRTTFAGVLTFQQRWPKRTSGWLQATKVLRPITHIP
jgi:hypothetical protein